MTELFEAIASWKSLLLVVATFGFAPGFVLRLLVKIYPRDDPRRQELIAELYTMGRIERPLFVAEQLETVLFEGLSHRRRSRRRKIEPETKNTGEEQGDKVPPLRSAQPEGTTANNVATLKKGARITGSTHDKLAADIKKKYEKGASIRALAESTGRTYGFIHRVLSESGVQLRGRGGATRTKSR